MSMTYFGRNGKEFSLPASIEYYIGPENQCEAVTLATVNSLLAKSPSPCVLSASKYDRELSEIVVSDDAMVLHRAQNQEKSDADSVILHRCVILGSWGGCEAKVTQNALPQQLWMRCFEPTIPIEIELESDFYVFCRNIDDSQLPTRRSIKIIPKKKKTASSGHPDSLRRQLAASRLRPLLPHENGQLTLSLGTATSYTSTPQ